MLADEYPQIVIPVHAHRWAATNPALGTELDQFRSLIVSGSSIDLGQFDEISYRIQDRKFVPRLADEAHRAQGQSLIMHPGTSHAQSIHIAKNLQNRFSAIEPRSVSTLRSLCRDLDAADDW